MSITRHRCIDRLRTRQRRSRVIEEAGIVNVPYACADQQGLREDEIAGVRSALETLPPEQRQAIQMAFFGGLTHLEIAEALKEPLGTIKARIRRGMLKLRESLEAYL